MPKVSVIIPAYNVSRYIKQSLESVLSQDYDNLEIIVVNSGSTDGLEKILEPYLADTRIKYLKTEKKGVSHTINRGLANATGDYISFLHGDDVFMPGKIKKQVTLMERRPSCGVSYTNENYFFEGSNRQIKSQNFHPRGDVFYFLKRSNFIHMSTAMVRKNVLIARTLDEGLACHEEWDLFLKLSQAGVKFLYVDETLSNIRIHSENLSSDASTMDATRGEVGERARILWKDFKKNINIFSRKGVSNLKRYIVFKVHAFLIGFPKQKKFNPKSPLLKSC